MCKRRKRKWKWKLEIGNGRQNNTCPQSNAVVSPCALILGISILVPRGGSILVPRGGLGH